MKNSILNAQVSCFKNYNTPTNPHTVNLLTWLNSDKYKSEVERLRQIDSKKERDAIKATLPAIAPSGTFTYRAEKNLITHSGFIQLDIDLDSNNKYITNWEQLPREIAKIPNVAYFGKSVSGKGYWGLIPILYPDKHKEHFEALFDWFGEHGITLDRKPQNPASLRGYSYDPNAYFNHNATPLKTTKKIEAKKPKHVPVPIANNNRKKYSGSDPERRLTDWLVRKLESYGEKERYHGRFAIGRLAGGYIAGGFLDETEIISELTTSYLTQYGGYDNEKTQRIQMQQFINGIDRGKTQPITELPKHFTNPIRSQATHNKSTTKPEPKTDPLKILPGKQSAKPAKFRALRFKKFRT